MSATLPGSFILSLPRAGSTLLRLLLDTHPEIYAPDELRLGRLCHSLQIVFDGLAETGGLDAGRRIEASRQGAVNASPGAIAETRALVGGLLAEAARRKGRRMWCEKSPENLEYLAVLERVFPDARFILLHRHCLDFVASCLGAGRYGFNLMVVGRYLAGHQQNFVIPLVEAWVEETARLLVLEERRGERCFRLRYEDLVADPGGRLEQLCAFLGVGYDPALIDRVFSAPHHQRLNAGDGHAFFSTAITAEAVGRGKEIPWDRVRSLPPELFAAMNRTLARLGYPPVASASWSHGVEFATRGDMPVRTAPPTPRALDAVRELFERRLPALLARGTPPALAGCRFTFVISGEEGGSWVIDLTGERGRVSPTSEPAGLQIHIAGHVLALLAAGHANPAMAYSEGRIRLEGGSLDLESLRALAALLTAPPPPTPSPAPGAAV